jgi:Tfp pilus assembly protein PilF
MLAHKDDYAQYLPVFVVSLDAAVSSGASSFEESIKKCSKVIQRKEHSRWIDHSFLLIGECYYLRRNFFDAIETFQYVNTKFKGNPVADLASVWLIRCYTSTKQHNRAQAVLDRSLEAKRFESDFMGWLYLAAAESQIAQKRWAKGAEYLELAVNHRLPRDQRRRTHFLLGQIYLDIESRKAPAHFRKALRLKPEPEMSFQCKIRMASAYTDIWEGNLKAQRILQKLVKSKKYFAYRDVLYYELSQIDLARKDTKSMLFNLGKSLESSPEINTQRKKTWLAMADHYFDAKNYGKAQLFFDSLGQNTEKDHPRFKEIKNKQNYLGDLVKNLQLVEMQDSLLVLGAMDENRLIAKIDRILEAEKQEAAREKARKADSVKAAANAASSSPMFIDPRLVQRNMMSTPTASAGGEWHFYNNQVLGADLNQFMQLWGKRENKDHWRRSTRSQSDEPGDQPGSGPAVELTPEQALADSIAKLPRTRETLLQQIPRDEISRNRSLDLVRKAHVMLAKGYKDRFMDYPASLSWLNKHLKRFQGAVSEPEVLYQSYLCYDLTGKSPEKNQIRQLLDSLYPESSYARLLKGSYTANADSIHQAADRHYRECYRLYSMEMYDSVIVQCKLAKASFGADTLMPYFGFLETVSAARRDTGLLIRGLETFVNRPDAGQIALAARTLLDFLQPSGAKGAGQNPFSAVAGGKGKDRYEFKPDSLQPHYLILRMDASVYKKNIEIGVKLVRFAEKNFQKFVFKMSYPLYKEVEQLVLLRELPDQRTAHQFWREALADKELFSDLQKDQYHWFYASKENYGKLYKNLSLNEYLNSFYQENTP